jgi:acyl-CoA synthetase (AMP-forming)/AMP-acid ligase II
MRKNKEDDEQTLLEGLGTWLTGITAGVLSTKSPGASLALMVTAATYDQIVNRSERERKKLKIVAKNTKERRANIRYVNDLISKYGYNLDSMVYLPNDGMEWELTKR